MRAGLYPVVGLLVLVAGCAGNQPVRLTPQLRQSTAAPAADAMSDADVSREVERLRGALLLEVPEHTNGNADGARAWIAPRQGRR